MVLAATIFATTLLALVHVFVGKLRFLKEDLAAWNSAAAGIGISYAFLVLLPKLAAAQGTLETVSESSIYGFLAHHAYFVALSGLVFYYVMDVAVERVLVLPERRAWRPAVRLLVHAHAVSLMGYYVLVSYLMSEQVDGSFIGYVSLLLFGMAMILHYATIDFGLRRKYGGLYDRYMRWVFFGASITGWVLATASQIAYTTIALLNSLFAGALLVFTLREKMPGTTGLRFVPFLAATMIFSSVIFALELLTA